jgi:hypothetical protein
LSRVSKMTVPLPLRSRRRRNKIGGKIESHLAVCALGLETVTSRQDIVAPLVPQKIARLGLNAGSLVLANNISLLLWHNRNLGAGSNALRSKHDVIAPIPLELELARSAAPRAPESRRPSRQSVGCNDGYYSKRYSTNYSIYAAGHRAHRRCQQTPQLPHRPNSRDAT